MKKLLTVLLVMLLLVLTTALADADVTGNWYAFNDNGAEIMLTVQNSGDYSLLYGSNFRENRIMGKWHMENDVLWLDGDALNVGDNTLRYAEGDVTLVFMRNGLDLSKLTEDKPFRESNTTFGKPWKAAYVHMDGETEFYSANRVNIDVEITLDAGWMDIRLTKNGKTTRLIAVANPKSGTKQYTDNDRFFTVCSIVSQNMLLLELPPTENGKKITCYMVQE